MIIPMCSTYFQASKAMDFEQNWLVNRILVQFCLVRYIRNKANVLCCLILVRGQWGEQDKTVNLSSRHTDLYLCVTVTKISFTLEIRLDFCCSGNETKPDPRETQKRYIIRNRNGNKWNEHLHDIATQLYFRNLRPTLKELGMQLHLTRYTEKPNKSKKSYKLYIYIIGLIKLHTKSLSILS